MSSLLEKKAAQPMPDPAMQRERWSPTDFQTWTLLGCAAVLLLAISFQVPVWWYGVYTRPGSEYAYGPIVPVLVGLMLWHRRPILRAVPKQAFFGAVLLLLPALGLMILACKRELFSLAPVGFFVALWSSLWLLLGTRWMRAAAYPLAFLVWMTPLPGPILHEGTYAGQQFFTMLTDKTLHLLTFPTLVNGNLIVMQNFTLFVDLPCSGMKLLLTLLMFGSALAFLVDGPPLRRLALFLFSLPLVLVVNVARITTLGIVGETLGIEAEKTIHDASGWVAVLVGAALLFAAARKMGFRRLAPQNPAAHPRDWKPQVGWNSLVLVLIFVPVLVFFLAWNPVQPVLASGLSSADIPKSVAGFTSPGDLPRNEFLQKQLPGATIITRQYAHGNEPMGFLLVKAEHGADMHDPRTCMGNLLLSVPQTKRLTDTPITMQVYRGSARPGDPPNLLVAYFYFANGRVISSPSDIRTALFWDDLLGRHTAPIYFFRFVQPLSSDSDDHLDVFVTQLWRQLQPKLESLSRTRGS